MSGGEEATPIVESKSFVPGPSSGRSSSTDSPMSPERLIEVDQDQEKSCYSQKGVAIPSRKDSPPISPVTDMSASYHEIFDTQLMASVAGIDLRDRDQDQDEDDEDVVNARLGGPLQSLDNNTASTTEYLTSKLVEDSLKWQKECSSQLPAQDSSKNSPAKKRPQTLLPTSILPGSFNLQDDSTAIKSLSLKEEKHTKKLDTLDPNAIEDIERHAKYLAACVDSMVENLSGVLQSASALTVGTLETYRDGVCKTCDEVDNNIRSMYQLMAKVEELNKSMTPVYKVNDQIKELKQLLDIYESCL